MTYFLGRKEELGELTRCATERVGTDREHLVCVEGEAGAGKTALLEAFERSQTDTLVLRVGHSEECWHPPYDTVTAILLELEGKMGSPVFEKVLARPGRLALLVPELVGGPVVVTAGVPELAEEVARLLKCAARQAPLLILADDCQFADGASVGLLKRVVPLLGDAPVLLVTAIESRVPQHGLACMADRRLSLRGLSRAELWELASTFLGEPVDPAWAIALSEYTGGSPLFVTMLLRSAICGSRPASPAELPVPDDITKRVQRTLGRLSEPARQLVYGAAVLPPESLVSRAGRVGGLVGDPREALEEAASWGLIDRVGPGLRLRAPVLGRAAIEALPPRRRRQLIQRIGPGATV